MALHHGHVLVFAGAGISRASGLPLFGSIRDGALRSLGLRSYVTDPGPSEVASRDRELAWALTPEPFLGALRQAGIDVASWLHSLLGGGTPGVVHSVLRQHLDIGGAVWTVNYDELIEKASTQQLTVAAWPDPPNPRGERGLHKPHGTLGGPLISTSQDVLQPLGEDWLGALRAATSGRIVVFIGYSGLDFDFHPHWNEVLVEAHEVVWFAFDEPAEQARIRRMLPDVDRRQKLSFVLADPAVPASRNPSFEFLRWWRRNGLGDITDAQIDSTLHELPQRPVKLTGSPPGAAGALLSVLSDLAGARRAYARDVPRAPISMLKRLGVLQVNHGGRGTANLLHLASLTPRVGKLAQVSSYARRKESTILANLGMHDRVLKRTDDVRDSDVSTMGINRATSMKMVGNLDEAARIAASAYAQARKERHAVRTANAAFQWAQACLWAYRIDDAQFVVEEHLEPIARVASGRWLAWHSYLRGCIAINRGMAASGDALDGAARDLHLASERFMVEGLIDGYVSVQIAEVVRRQALGERPSALSLLNTVRSGAHPIGTYYTARHPYNETVVDLLEAELLRMTGERERAHLLFTQASGSTYPLLAANGSLGLAALAHGRDAKATTDHVREACDIARSIGARYFVAMAERMKAGEAVAEILWV